MGRKLHLGKVPKIFECLRQASKKQPRGRPKKKSQPMMVCTMLIQTHIIILGINMSLNSNTSDGMVTSLTEVIPDACVCAHGRMRVCVCAHAHTCTCVCVHMHTHICMYVGMCTCYTCVCMILCVCVCVCMHIVCMYMYTCTMYVYNIGNSLLLVSPLLQT